MNHIFGRKYAVRSFDNCKECWLYLQDVPKFANFASKHHVNASNNKKQDNNDDNGDSTGDRKEAKVTQQRCFSGI